MADPASAPLPTLLARVLGASTAEVEAAAGVGPGVASLAVWSNVLRCVAEADPDGLDERALPEAARLSARLSTSAITGAARRGWLTAEPGTGGPKRRHLELTRTGRAAATVWPPALAALDRTWAGTPLRRALEVLVGQLPFELPHFPASYGAADPSATGGAFVQGSTSPDGVPARGRDWRPVHRVGDGAVAALPVTSLLSQALMAFTIDYEDRFPWPLASTATVLVHLRREPRPLADVPGDHGIVGNGRSLLERHLIATVSRDPSDPRRKLVALTDRGAAVLQHHPGRLAAVEADWRGRYGDDVVTALRDALAPVAADADPTLPDHVVGTLHDG